MFVGRLFELVFLCLYWSHKLYKYQCDTKVQPGLSESAQRKSFGRIEGERDIAVEVDGEECD